MVKDAGKETVQEVKLLPKYTQLVAVEWKFTLTYVCLFLLYHTEFCCRDGGRGLKTLHVAMGQ